ncbi:extracellular solute-binding protein, partial [Candidatus Woesebacteria bacterium]|nr:extracellular solute-binding protein [Candidatus Woesebacteria bacterium]
AMPTAQPQPVSSRLMQNLQSVNPTPFQETSVPPMGGMPDSGQASAGQPSLPTSNVPQENIGFSLTDASAANGGNGGDSSGNGSAPPSSPSSGGGTPKPAKAGGMLDSLLQSRVTLFGGIALLIAALLGGGYYVYSQFLAPAPTPVVNTNPGTGNSNTKSTTLTYWGLWEPEEVMQPLIDAYETQNPGITINYVQQKSDQYRQRVQTAIRDGSGPDIFRYHNTWMPMVKSDLSPAPAAVFGPEELEQNFYPIMSRDLVSNNAVYGVPLMYEGLVLLYNQNMLESAGAQPPQDWNQVRSLASQLTIRNGERIERAGIALGTAGNVDHFSDIVGLMLLQNGANPGDPTSDNVVDAMEYYSVYSREDKVWDDTFPNSVAAFSNEQVAMIFAPSWRIFEIQQANPNINIGVVRTPQLGGTTVTWGTYWVEGVSASSKNKQEAWKFLAYLAREEQLREFHDAGSAYRAFGELYPRVEMAENLTTNPLIRPYLEDALYAQSWYLASQTHDEGLNDQMIQYYTDAVNAMNSTSGNVEKALEQIAPGVQQVLSRYSIAVPSAPAAQ